MKKDMCSSRNHNLFKWYLYLSFWIVYAMLCQATKKTFKWLWKYFKVQIELKYDCVRWSNKEVMIAIFESKKELPQNLLLYSFSLYIYYIQTIFFKGYSISLIVVSKESIKDNKNLILFESPMVCLGLLIFI